MNTEWTRPETGIAHYRGDRVASLLADPVKGPDTAGELHAVTNATYDAATDRTTAHFAYATTADVTP